MCARYKKTKLPRVGNFVRNSSIRGSIRLFSQGSQDPAVDIKNMSVDEV